MRTAVLCETDNRDRPLVDAGRASTAPQPHEFIVDTREVADPIGAESERIGAHYTRHVEAEQNIIRAFGRIKDRQDKA